MKKRIIFIGLCFVLLLIFTSSSYGGEDPRYKLKADPWEEMNLCPAQDTTQVSCDQALCSNALRISVIQVLGISIILTRDLNCLSIPGNRDDRPSIFQEK